MSCGVMSIKPPSRPQATRAAVVAAAVSQLAAKGDHRPLEGLFLVGVRGYYQDTMGAPGRNDVGLYDDALFIVGIDMFAGFNANTDPSRQTPGIATLIAPGRYPYRKGNHGISKPGGGYPAFRPATKDEALPVTRAGQKGISEGIAINIHRGGINTTSSAGCQTIPPDQWDTFYAIMSAQLKATGQEVFDYVPILGPIA